VIAITGATGFIGGHLAAHLAGRGDKVRAIVRGSSVVQGLPRDIAVVRAPLETTALAEAFRGVDVVVHLAGVVSTVREREFFDVNVEGTRAVAEATRTVGARLVYISSLAAAGPSPPSAPRDEDDPPAPMNAYGRSKLDGERVVAATPDLPWTILRPGVVYGPRDRALLPLFRCASLGVLPLVGRATAAYMFVHVSDLVRAIAAAVDRGGERDTLFVGHQRAVTTRGLLEAVRRAAGRRALLVRVPMAVTRLLAMAGDVGGRILGRPLAIDSRRYHELSAEGFVCRVDRLRDRLGIVAEIDLEEGLRETVAWYRREGWL
jgi:nucleoside-diphosphate-sugar epimerase